jgi:hypothetical protein
MTQCQAKFDEQGLIGSCRYRISETEVQIDRNFNPV